MSYTFTLYIYQNDSNAHFRTVEKTVWNYANGGIWDKIREEDVLVIGGSGTSGTLRFISDSGENFIVALGVHNYKTWTDIVTNLKTDQTGTSIHPEYYNGGGRAYAREKQLTSYSVKNAKGRTFEVKVEGDGKDLKAHVRIG